jgi:hypothetical protein
VERGLWIYPWDLAYEGIEQTLDKVQRLGFDALYLAVAYHSGRLLLPHNPSRKLHFLEGASLYFRPDPRPWAGAAITPHVSDLADERIVERTLASARSRGLRVGAWVVCLHNSRLGAGFPQLTVKNAFADSLRYSLCPSNPEVAVYVSRVLASVASVTPPFDVVQLESPNFLGITHGYHHELAGVVLDPATEFLLGVCFCESCREKALGEGLDAEGLAGSVKTFIDGQLSGRSTLRHSDWSSPEQLEDSLGIPKLAAFIHLRTRIVSRFISAAADAVGPDRKVKVLVKGGPALWKVGVSLENLARSPVDPVILLYSRDPAEVNAEFDRAIQALGASVPPEVGLRVIEPDCPDATNLAAKVRSLAATGVRSFVFYNYGLASEEALSWVPRAFASHR